jgi:starch synthase
MEACGGVNFLKGGIYFSNKLTTVSPNYAKEIQTNTHGCGLDSHLRFRSGDLIGILNGIDDEIWDPQTDPHITARYSVKNLRGKSLCKKDFCREHGLRDGDAPLFTAIARFCEQKGLDALAEALPAALDSMRICFALLGSGDPHLQWQFQQIAERYPGRAFVRIGYDEILAHKMKAAGDFFLMPSRFEPCGLSQMYALRYGTLPIVRNTGGLSDTVKNYDEKTGAGTGFLFDHLSAKSLYDVIGWACSTYYDRPTHKKALMRRAMGENFSWEKSVQRYRDCYEWALQMKR